ncbi:type II toxin-antitoxin system RelE family toxin [Rhodococcus aetherivorans]
MSVPGEPYTLIVARTAARALERTLPEKVAAAVYEFLTGPLLENPHRVGKELAPPLAPACSARRGSYRVLYLIDENTRQVRVTAISHRADAYRT